ncbi:hypothetical protein PHYSODRAFT_299041 [Phytophthora sojae]|uniref:RxLR effector protein n=1 Tax=Phytophthora sojae (strain P6497) TaxID=1094619 RepID=G4ZAZ3_PHYSP|nr:hypothetical protein PHYSODRAFT_299041 [Phytophthora sojae]EGZ21212.1 hypothetical protein PHYSODRAFT_299041 [Phytophthora sojae]|eukprot:XP_009523929.1 hypothetical protein PHYSODRAFT_299041 [Phytophthora sojae]
MRFLGAFLLAICLLSAVVGYASALAYYPDQTRISANLQRFNTGEKLNADIEDDSEKAYIPGLSPLAGAESKISPSAQNLANKLWLKWRTGPALVCTSERPPRSSTTTQGSSCGSTQVNRRQKFSGCCILTEQAFQLKNYKLVGATCEHSRFLQQKYDDSEIELVRISQALKQRPELESLGDNVQSFLFSAWIDQKLTPELVQSRLAIEKVLKTVRGLFANDKPDEALPIATKLG